ncbi:MAG: hypothetical protein GVY17_02195 [Cyanobacteria bacterium]|jgi:hypothetical protein|nr:hypothetical protein [Cyanobacteria bacterium GSL.Bin21]
MISAKSFSLALLLSPLAWSLNAIATEAKPPTPGTGATNASLLAKDSHHSQQAANPTANNETVAQVRRRQRVIRRQPVSPNYIGVGLNLGIDGSTALGDTEFAINGRIKITPDLSFRPGAIIGENAVILVPVTYDFTPQDLTVAERSLALMPYVGGGIFFTTDDESEDDLGALVTGGVDIPISRQFTANAALNVGFTDDDAEFGVLLGVAYNIPGN